MATLAAIGSVRNLWTRSASRAPGVRLLYAAVILVVLGSRVEAAPPPLEYQVKASYIYNLIQFIQWPADSIGDEFQICVFGAHRFGDALDALEGNRLDDRPLKVRYLRDLAEANSCQVVFFTAALDERTPHLLRAAPADNLLTIGETRSFTDEGGIVGLIKVGGKVKFEINEAAAQRAGLTISAQLLRLAIRR